MLSQKKAICIRNKLKTAVALLKILILNLKVQFFSDCWNIFIEINNMIYYL